jgi:hypothetical protein
MDLWKYISDPNHLTRDVLIELRGVKDFDTQIGLK